MEIKKTIKEEILRLERSYIIARKTSMKLKKYFENKGIPSDILDDEFNSLRCGDTTTEDFMKAIEKVTKELNEKEG